MLTRDPGHPTFLVVSDHSKVAHFRQAGTSKHLHLAQPDHAC
jgi:hypothetical protein